MAKTSATDETHVLSPTATWVAVGTALLYGVITVILFSVAHDSTEITWTRYVYLYSGLEAIVFAAVGALFGTKVQRAQTTAARAQTTKAEEDASTARAETEVVREAARHSEELAAAGLALRHAIITERQVAASESAPPPAPRKRAASSRQDLVGGSGPAADVRTEEPALDRLALLAERLFG